MKIVFIMNISNAMNVIITIYDYNFSKSYLLYQHLLYEIIYGIAFKNSWSGCIVFYKHSRMKEFFVSLNFMFCCRNLKRLIKWFPIMLLTASQLFITEICNCIKGLFWKNIRIHAYREKNLINNYVLDSFEIK